MAVAEGILQSTRTIRAGPATTMVIDRLTKHSALTAAPGSLGLRGERFGERRSWLEAAHFWISGEEQGGSIFDFRQMPPATEEFGTT